MGETLFTVSHILEKALYPTDKIYTRNKEAWLKILHDLNLKVEVQGGNIFFPDSTKIFICKKLK
jgi:hypothetical protein